MEILTDPNVSYVLLILGFLTAVLALFSPGTGLLEVIALFALAVAGYGIANQPINLWAFALMGLGFIPFIASLFQKQNLRIILLVVAALLFVLGSALLFRGEGWRPAVNILLILLLSPLALGGTWLIATKSLDVVFLSNAIRIVPEYQRLVVFRLGRSLGDKGPGIVSDPGMSLKGRACRPARAGARNSAANLDHQR
jgi:membrane-bound ClpP family serine protease